MNNNGEFRKSPLWLSQSADSWRPRTSIGLRWRQNLRRAVVFIYIVVIVMQREREAFHVGALTNMAALTGESVVIFVIRNLSVPVA